MGNKNELNQVTD